MTGANLRLQVMYLPWRIFAFDARKYFVGKAKV